MRCEPGAVGKNTSMEVGCSQCVKAGFLLSELYNFGFITAVNKACRANNKCI